MSTQVFILDHHCLHDDDCCSPCGGLFRSSPMRFDLYMGRGECGTQVCKIFRFHSCLVVLHCVDDIYSWKLSSMILFSHNFTTSLIFSQNTANYIVSQLVVWEIEFPGGISNNNVKWRATVWAISEGLLILAVAINYLPPRMYSLVFRFSIFLMMVDFFLCLIWLPIGVSKTYGFRSAQEVFTQTCE
jgi:hypothetical protein